MSQQPQLEAFSKIVGMLETAIFNGSAGGGQIANSTRSCFDASMLYKEKTSTVSQVYLDILEQSALPEKQLSSTEASDLRRMESEIEKMMDAYLRYKQRFDAINGELIGAQASGAPTDVVRKLKDKRDTAEQEWITYGKKSCLKKHGRKYRTCAQYRRNYTFKG